MLALRLQRCVTSFPLRCGPVSSCPPEHSACQPFSVVTPLCLSCLQSLWYPMRHFVSQNKWRVLILIETQSFAKVDSSNREQKVQKFSTYSEYFVYTEGGVSLLQLCLRLVSHRFHKWAGLEGGQETWGENWLGSSEWLGGRGGGCNSWHRTAWWGNTAAVSAQSRVIRRRRHCAAILSPCWLLMARGDKKMDTQVPIHNIPQSEVTGKDMFGDRQLKENACWGQ